jgi:rfaE bifunctional protein nucleotidyltransferase chain/domain
MTENWKEAHRRKRVEPSELPSLIAKLRKEGKTIATLNGSFDLLHAGHLHMIYEASQQADVLIIALNSDSSIQQYKSIHRPIIPLEYRIQMMTALGFVDYVTWFDETDPRTILTIIKPDVHVNGAEYGQDCIEAETVKSNGGRIHIVQLVDGLSTSAVIKKILSLPKEGK